MSDTARIPMTKEGYEKLKAELDRMNNIEMVEVAKRIAAAREMGDLREMLNTTPPGRIRVCCRPRSTLSATV